MSIKVSAPAKKLLSKILRGVLPWVLLLFVVNWWQTRHMVTSGELIDGQALALPHLAETPELKVTPKRLVYFFAPWCQVCHANIDNLTRVAEWTDSKEIAVVLVVLDWSSEAEVKKFLEEHKLNFPVLLGQEETGRHFGVQAYPSYYILDRDNRVLTKTVGYSPTIAMLLRIWWG